MKRRIAWVILVVGCVLGLGVVISGALQPKAAAPGNEGTPPTAQQPAQPSLPAQPASPPIATKPGNAFAAKLGVGLEGIGGRGLEFVDAAKTLRSFEAAKGGPVAKDANGWPKGDCRTVIFDLRPSFAWAPPMDDPDDYRINVSGAYKLSFSGQATMSSVEEPTAVTIANQQYDAKTNTTTVDVTLKPGKGLFFLNFTKTKRTADAKEGTGITNLKALRPGYAADTKAIFTKAYLTAIAPFAVLRFMDFTQTNNHTKHNGYYPKVIEWKERTRPDHATQAGDELDGATHKGAAWEYVIALANATGKDIWINVPHEASDDYVKQLAALMKKDLNPKTAIYLEDSNEVWNWMFTQAVYNKMAAEDEVKKGNSNLVNDGKTDLETIRARRHARRTLEIGKTFREVFGKTDAGRIRPVFCWWVIQPNGYAETLQWVEKTYGPPKDYFTAIGGTAYFNYQDAPKDASIDKLLEVMRASADGGVATWEPLHATAKQYGLKSFIYEGGSDTGGGDKTNVANRIRAERSPKMGALVKHQLQDNWYAKGGDLFMYFTLSSAYSRYGCWGAVEDITKLDSPKYRALLEVMGKN